MIQSSSVAKGLFCNSSPSGIDYSNTDCNAVSVFVSKIHELTSLTAKFLPYICYIHAINFFSSALLRYFFLCVGMLGEVVGCNNYFQINFGRNIATYTHDKLQEI